MKAQELRIGNFIGSGITFSRTSSVGKVLSIGSEEEIFEQIYCECDESFEWFFKDNYCGIPLTPEWLERFGFENVTENNDLNTHFQISKNGFAIRFEITNPSNLPYCFVEMIGVDITKVHQLQNLYFALTGKELELKQ